MAYKSIRIKEETYEDLKGLSNDWELSLDETVVKLLDNRTPARPPQAPPKDNGLPFTSEQIDYLAENFVGTQAKEIEGMRLSENNEDVAPSLAASESENVKPTIPGSRHEQAAHHLERARTILPNELEERLEGVQDRETIYRIQKDYKQQIDTEWKLYKMYRGEN